MIRKLPWPEQLASIKGRQQGELAMDESQTIANLESQITELDLENNSLHSRIDDLQDQLREMEAEKLAAEELVQELTDALSDIRSAAERALR